MVSTDALPRGGHLEGRMHLLDHITHLTGVRPGTDLCLQEDGPLLLQGGLHVQTILHPQGIEEFHLGGHQLVEAVMTERIEATEDMESHLFHVRR